MRSLIGRLGWICLVLAIILSFMQPQAHVQGATSEPVYVIPVHQTIEQGLESFLHRAFEEAEGAAAKAIILEIDTFGGAVDAASGIGNLISTSSVPVTAFIRGNAASAGAYIALNADQIVMTPNASMGAAAVRDIQGQEVDPKITSFWASKMKAAAEAQGRDPLIAQAMVDPKVTIPGVKEDDKAPLTLTAQEALNVGYAESIQSNLNGVLEYMELAEQPVVQVSLTASEQLARWITHPFIMPLLLVIGIGGIVFEMLAPGFGFPGLLGLSSLILFFFGHYVAGFAGIEDIFLFVGGIVLMIIELFVPGFGIFGIIGIVSLTLGIVLASYDTTFGFVSLGIALVVSLGIAIYIIKYLGHRGTWNRLILKDEMKTDQGYVSVKNRTELIGKQGKTLTPLRPSGTVLIDEQRVDAVSEGSFIALHKEVVVVKVEGHRIVVRPVDA